MKPQRRDVDDPAFSVDALIEQLLAELDYVVDEQETDVPEVSSLAVKVWLPWHPRHRRKIN